MNMKKLLLLFLAVGTLVSCSKSEDSNPEFKINQKEVKLNYDGSFNFKVENASNVSWTSSDEFVGTIGSDGKFEAKHIGEVTITGKVGGSSVSAKVVVEPYITGVVEPFFDFTKGASSVKSYEKRKLISETSTFIYYSDANKYVTNSLYSLEGGVLKSSALMFVSSSAENVVKFYGERYKFDGYEDKIGFFTSKDAKIMVGVTVDANLGLVALYMPNTSKNKASIKMASKDYHSVIKNIK